MRDPERTPFGTEGNRAHPMFEQMLALAKDAFVRHGPGCAEKVYEQAMLDLAREHGIPCLKQRFINMNHYSPRRLGRVDLEVDGRYVLELKITAPTECNVQKDREEQIDPYLQAYAFNDHTIDCAALIYFTPTGVVVVPVDPRWIFREKGCDVAEPEPSLEKIFQQLSVGPSET